MVAKMKNATLAFLKYAPWAISAGALVFTLWAFLAQIDTQDRLNEAMHGVRANVAQARELTHQTAEALAPLANTAKTLEGMNQGLRSTVIDIKAMNESMGRVIVRQQAMLVKLERLGDHTAVLVDDLGDVDAVNRRLLGATEALAEQTNGQASSIGSLSDLTQESIDDLATLNRRLSFLRGF